MKIGRNEPCPCGSGKKYKVCCYGKPVRDARPSPPKPEKTDQPLSTPPEKALWTTQTGELYQPVKLRYEIKDETKLRAAFSKLRCIDFDPSKNRWVWLFDYEARTIQLKKTYSSPSDSDGPIIIGSFFIRSGNELHLEVRSIERAIAAILFFDKHLGRKIAEIKYLEIVNRLFDGPGPVPVSLSVHFDALDEKAQVDPNELVKEIKALQDQTDDPNLKRAIASKYIEEISRRPEPEVERLPVRFYEEGIKPIEMSLGIRQIVAMKHWQGNPTYSTMDAIRDMLTGRR